MDIASYEERSDPESLRIKKNWKRPHLYLKTESQNWWQWTIKWLEKIKWKRLRSRTWIQCKENNEIWNLISVLVIITHKRPPPPSSSSSSSATTVALLRSSPLPLPPFSAAAAITLKFHPKHVTNKNKTKHIMKISHINVNIYDRTAASQ